MRCVSTRGGAEVSIDAALSAGLAPDGGLYVPVSVPAVSITTPGATLADTALMVLQPFFAGSRLHDALRAICDDAFTSDAPLRPMRGAGDFLLELFHGPTCAFKDFGARFLASSLHALRGDAVSTLTILVATSGDTGAAVASAFQSLPGFRVVILYPEGGVSPRQAHGLECWGDAVRTCRVQGTFDDCQAMAKAALSDTTLRARMPLASANSISLGRLLPQAAYHAHAALHCRALTGQPLNLVIPTGNLGNACAAVMARRMGLPIGDIVLATNANDTLPRFFAGAGYATQPSVPTLANAMDVGAPSNFERLRAWHADDAELRASLTAHAVDDVTILDTIRRAPAHHGVVPCPHTATALHVLEAIRARGDTRPWAACATAHPAKFADIVEPAIGAPVPVPPALATMDARHARFGRIAASPEALVRVLLQA